MGNEKDTPEPRGGDVPEKSTSSDTEHERKWLSSPRQQRAHSS